MGAAVDDAADQQQLQQQQQQQQSPDDVAPLVNSESWDDEWLEAEIARELAAYEDTDTRPLGVDAASGGAGIEGTAEGRSGGGGGGGGGSAARGAWEQTRAEARARAREINTLPHIEIPADDTERPTKDGGRGQSRQDDAIDALVQYMQERDAQYVEMEAKMEDDIASVMALAAGVEGTLGAAAIRSSDRAAATAVAGSAGGEEEEEEEEGQQRAEEQADRDEAPSASDLVSRLQQLSKRSPTGRLASALESSDGAAGYDYTKVEELSRKTEDILKRVGQTATPTHSSGGMMDTKQEGGAGI